MATRQPDRVSSEEEPGVTFSVYPYDHGCDVHPTTRVDVDVLADPGGGRGEWVRARCDGECYEFQRNARGDLEPIEPVDEPVPEWVRTAIVELGIGRVRE